MAKAKARPKAAKKTPLRGKEKAAPAKKTYRKKAGNAPDVPPPPAEPPDPRHRELRASVFANPKSTEARLVYADWLMENGDPRGEYIRYDILWESMAFDDPKVNEIRDLVAKLFRKHEKEWVAPIRPYIRTWAFHRGFVSHVVCDAGLFIEGAHALVATAPGLTVQLTGLKSKQVPMLAACPLGKLGRLDISSQRLSDPQMEELFASPTLSGLEDLDLGWNGFGPRGARALVGSPCAASLRELKLDRTPIGDDGVAAIGASNAFPNLVSLELSQTGCGAAGAGAFARGRFPALEYLTLQQNEAIGDDGARRLAEADGLAALKRLQLALSGLTEAGALALAGSKKLPASLVELGLSFQKPMSDEARKIVLARFPNAGL